jgi:hypothetical protein
MTIEEKAERLLVTGSVTVLNAVAATIKGDHDTYAVYREPDRWRDGQEQLAL